MMSIKNTLRASASMILAGTLAACGGGGSGSPTPAPVATSTPTPTAGASFQSQFGSTFAGIFNASATGDPVDPTDASVPALAPASDPIDNPPG